MQAMILETYGQAASFQWKDVPKPEPRKGHVVIKIAATSVNTVDTMIRQMGNDLPLSPELPAILGMDFAGTVESVGDDVTGFVNGDEVYGCAGGLADLPGALAEYMLVDAKLIAHKPKSLSMKEAAALPLVGITAYEGLERSQASAGQKILVHGGTGGVGHVAVQLAKHLEAEVYATISDQQSADIVRGYGAQPINYKSETVADYVSKHTADSGFDVVFDSVGGANMLNSFEAAKLNGQVATTVSMLELDLTAAHFKGLSIHVVFMLIPMLHDYRREDHGSILGKIAHIVDAGALKPLVDAEQFNIADTDRAYERLTSGQAVGKVVIEM